MPGPRLPRPFCRRGIRWRVWFIGFTFGWSTLLSQAGLPEPDSVVYGSVTVNGQPATALDTHWVIEARHEAAGPVVAATTLGAEPPAGDLYVLRIPMESGPPLISPLAAAVGDTLLLRVVQAGTVLEETTFSISARGQTQRVDLGAPVLDSDTDTLPDAWELATFGTLDYGSESVGLNGQTLLHNYIAGTNPNEPGSALVVSIESSEGILWVSFPARQAEGAGYEGLTRYYTLRSATDLAEGWSDVEGYTRVAPGTTDVVYALLSSGDPGFFHVVVWLE